MENFDASNYVRKASEHDISDAMLKLIKMKVYLMDFFVESTSDSRVKENIFYANSFMQVSVYLFLKVDLSKIYLDFCNHKIKYEEYKNIVENVIEKINDALKILFGEAVLRDDVKDDDKDSKQVNPFLSLLNSKKYDMFI